MGMQSSLKSELIGSSLVRSRQLAIEQWNLISIEAHLPLVGSKSRDSHTVWTTFQIS